MLLWKAKYATHEHSATFYGDCVCDRKRSDNTIYDVASRSFSEKTGGLTLVAWDENVRFCSCYYFFSDYVMNVPLQVAMSAESMFQGLELHTAWEDLVSKMIPCHTRSESTSLERYVVAFIWISHLHMHLSVLVLITMHETTSHIRTYMILLFYRTTLSLLRRRTRRKRRRRRRTRRRKMIRKTRKTKKRTRKIRRKTRRTKRIKRTRRALQPQPRSYFVCSSPHPESRKTANSTRRQPKPPSHSTKPHPLSR